MNFSGEVMGESRNVSYPGFGAGGADGGCPFFGDGGPAGAAANGDLHLADCDAHCCCRLEVFYEEEVITP